jgi:hypothetical protein
MLRALRPPWRLARFARRRKLDYMDMALIIRWSAREKFTVQVEDWGKVYFRGSFETYDQAVKAGDAAFKEAMESLPDPAVY